MTNALEMLGSHIAGKMPCRHFMTHGELTLTADAAIIAGIMKFLRDDTNCQKRRLG